MINLIVELSKYAILILMTIYTYFSFSVFRKKTENGKRIVWKLQIRLILLIHYVAYMVMFLKSDHQTEILKFYGAQVALLVLISLLFTRLYPGISRTILNNMCMFLMISFVMVTRLSFDKSVKQFKIVGISVLLVLIIPWCIKKLRNLNRYGYVYAGVGISLLLGVMILGQITHGAKLSITLFGFTFQPSEFVKILYVFFLAAVLEKAKGIKSLLLPSILAAIHVIVLVLSKDLGGALIYFVTYLVLLYAATGQPFYFLGGLLAGSGAAAIAYRLFPHVQARVLAWSDPFSVIENEGYQITQSLFAIGSGGWFGLGLYQGMPNKIPVVEQDFIFAAIAEELGGLFAICLILVCLSTFIMFVNISLQMKESFYKLAALGLGSVYAFQVFLTIGGVIKLIPSTGVTLPLVSYGGSSMLSSLIMFAVIQGFYLLRENEDGREPNETGKKARKKQQKEKQKS